MKVLVACEESQRVCSAFRARGHESYSSARVEYEGGTSMPAWYANLSKKDRAKERSKTFPGFAEAMAEQWGSLT